MINRPFASQVAYWYATELKAEQIRLTKAIADKAEIEAKIANAQQDPQDLLAPLFAKLVGLLATGFNIVGLGFLVFAAIMYFLDLY